MPEAKEKRQLSDFIILLLLLAVAISFLAAALFFVVKWNNSSKEISPELNISREIKESDERILRNFTAKSADEINPNFFEVKKILFVGDIMFDRFIRQQAEKKGYKSILEKAAPILSQYDFVIGNLEGPITSNRSVSMGTEIGSKKNFSFTFDPEVAHLLFENNIRTVSLGNNHILNFGQSGLTETEKYLRQNGVEFFGSPSGDKKHELVIGKDCRLALVSFNQLGSDNQEEVLKIIEDAKRPQTLVVVYPHWGIEYQLGDPGEKIKSLARQMINSGADLIVGTHPHVVQISEIIDGKKVYYSLGNFVFDQYFQKETMEGLAIGVEVSAEKCLIRSQSELKVKMNRSGETFFD